MLLPQQTSNDFLDLAAIENSPELLGRTKVAAMVGAFLDPYGIESKLGEGGMGEVFRAVDTRLGRSVTIKVMHE